MTTRNYFYPKLNPIILQRDGDIDIPMTTKELNFGCLIVLWLDNEAWGKGCVNGLQLCWWQFSNLFSLWSMYVHNGLAICWYVGKPKKKGYLWSVSRKRFLCFLMSKNLTVSYSQFSLKFPIVVSWSRNISASFTGQVNWEFTKILYHMGNIPEALHKSYSF